MSNLTVKKRLIKVLLTGTNKRRYLFKKLFTLSGVKEHYDSLIFSEGYSSGRRSRVVIKVINKKDVKDKIDVMREYVPSLRVRDHENKTLIFDYHKRDVDWFKIDSMLK